ncbi:hypothetical protein MTYP_01964 [Methylophilaceae bacterium]|nr:hypothetical protein MTYP_01964 [Methylophilaceae bacterium]
MTEHTNGLSEVLQRINALKRQSQVHDEHAMPVVDDSGHAGETGGIPRLTELYEGELPLAPVAMPASEPPVLNDFVESGEALPAVDIEPPPDLPPELTAEERSEALLAEMMPLIEAAARKAVLQELAAVEYSLTTLVEQEIVKSLKEKLKSGLS